MVAARGLRRWLVAGLCVCCIDFARVAATSEEEEVDLQCTSHLHDPPSQALLQKSAQRVAGTPRSKHLEEDAGFLAKAKRLLSLSKAGSAEIFDTKSENGVNEEDIQAFLDSYGMDKHLAREQATERAEKHGKAKTESQRLKARLLEDNVADDKDSKQSIAKRKTKVEAKEHGKAGSKNNKQKTQAKGNSKNKKKKKETTKKEKKKKEKPHKKEKKEATKKKKPTASRKKGKHK